MKQIYILIFLLFGLLFFTTDTIAQESPSEEKLTEREVSIEGLSIYPNPASGNKIYISTRLDQSKKIEVYNVLGKPILSADLNGKELNISSLDPGIYFLKIKEGNRSSTRKLVIR